jgi:hypothetical protein
MGSLNRSKARVLTQALRVISVAVALAGTAHQLRAQQTRPPVRPAPASGRAASTASVSVARAFRGALAKAPVRDAAKAEILRQLRHNRPLMAINGTLVTPIDYGRVYQVAAVHGAIAGALGQNGPALLTAAAADPHRIGLVFTPSTFGRLLLGDLAADVTASVGPAALRNTATGISPAGVLALVEVGSAIWDLFKEIWTYFTGGDDPTGAYIDPDADTDGDGLKNKDDPDDDNDGTPDNEDHYPEDKNKQICDCGRPLAGVSTDAVYVFGTNVPNQVVAGVLSMYSSAVGAQRTAVSLGTVGSGQAAGVAVVFGPSVP